MKTLTLITTLLLITGFLFAQHDTCPPSPVYECVQKEIAKVAAVNLVQDDTLFVHRKDINTNSDSIDLVIEEVGSLSGKFQLHVDKFPPLLEQVENNQQCCENILGEQFTIYVQHSSIFYQTDSVRYDFQRIGNRIFLEYSISIRNINTSQFSLKFDMPFSIEGRRLTTVCTMVSNGNKFESVASIVDPHASFIEFKRSTLLKWTASNNAINLTGQIWLGA